MLAFSVDHEPDSFLVGLIRSGSELRGADLLPIQSVEVVEPQGLSVAVVDGRISLPPLSDNRVVVEVSVDGSLEEGGYRLE